MSISIVIVDGPLPPAAQLEFAEAGARVCFEGVVRPTENGAPIHGLSYEAYEPMASKQMERICANLIATHKVLAISVEHSVGWVPAGECSFRLRVASRHRKEAFDAMQAFIDLLKQDVPIWKTPG